MKLLARPCGDHCEMWVRRRWTDDEWVSLPAELESGVQYDYRHRHRDDQGVSSPDATGHLRPIPPPAPQ
jgi:hypothetical protein